MANRLAAETSPYLRQHADNPVDWYPWGPEALERARELERPILLSIGYAACHWCHVMAHESFEDPGTAAVMNRLFVNIKVDREERPDLDAIYMQAVTTMTGRGGWPMTVFLTPAGEPFFGGTYFPPEPRDGSPSFTQVLEAIAETWADRRDNVEASAAHLTAQIARAVDLTARARPVDADVLDRAASAVAGQFDPRHGGFGRAPKFPLAMTIEFLLRHHLRTGAAMSLQMAEVSLERMARGGIYDQLGGGFARYSTDDAWLVPHFEKMLYDNALLARVYLHAWRITGRRLYRRVVEETLDWLLREMAAPGGGFYSSLDADSEGEEGRYYVWDAAELRGLLGADYEPFARVYGVTESGNWEGRNVLHLARTGASLASEMGVAPADLASRLVAARRRLVTARARRVRPSRDEKVITAWNGLALAALAEAGRALGRADLLAAAERCAAFLHGTMRGPGGRLHRTWSVGGTARLAGYLEDHAAVADGLVALYQATFDTAHLAWARELAEVMVSDFGDDEGGGFFDTADDHEELIRRPKEIQDNATPSGNALAATVLLDLARYTGDGEWWQIASEAVSGLTEWLDRAPTAFAQWLQAAWVLAGEPRELAVVLPAGQSGREAREGYWYGAASAGREAGSGAAPAEARPAAGWGPAAGMLAVIDAAWRPDLVVAVGDARDAAEVLLLADRPALDGRPTAYLCHRWACDAPTTDPATLVAALGYGASRPPGDAGTGGTPSGALAPGEQGAAGGAPTESRGA